MTKPVDHKDDGARVFADGRSIVIGKGRILWGTATWTSKNQKFEEGWVLLGGQRTTDFEVAQAYARWIDSQCRK